jgi:hypothetical protein
MKIICAGGPESEEGERGRKTDEKLPPPPLPSPPPSTYSTFGIIHKKKPSKRGGKSRDEMFTIPKGLLE